MHFTDNVSPRRTPEPILRSPSLGRHETTLMCNGNEGALPLPLWERVGVRGFGLSMEHNPSPGSHLRCDPTSPTRGEVSEPLPVAMGPGVRRDDDNQGNI